MMTTKFSALELKDFEPKRVVIKGAGDLATGISFELCQAGYQVVMTEIQQPTVVRRMVAFAEAVYTGRINVQGVTAQLAGNSDEVLSLLEQQVIPVLVDPQADIIKKIKPYFVVDAILAKKNFGTGLTDAPVVIGVGPGFAAGKDVDVVVESNRGPNLGKIYYEGNAEPNTGIPGAVDGYTLERVLRAPAGGVFTSIKEIGEMIGTEEVVGYINDQVPVKTQISGVIRGMLQSGLQVEKGLKLGDVEPRGVVSLCYTISDKAQKIGQAVLQVCEAKGIRKRET